MMRPMNDNQTHPYQLEVQASERKPGTFEWTIRKNGKLSERSDRSHRSEEDARKDGQKAVERRFADLKNAR